MNESDEITPGTLLIWLIILIGIVLAVWRVASGVDDGDFE